MRIRDKIRAISAATNDDGVIQLQVEEMLNGTEYQTLNWRQVGKALSLLIEGKLIDGHQGGDVENYLADMVNTRSYNNEHRLSPDQFSTLDSYIHDYSSELPTILRIMQRLHPDFLDDEFEPISREFAVELNIGSNGSIADTRVKFVAVSELFGTYLTLDRQVAIKGFDTGSDWVVFDALNALQTDFIVGVVACARDVINAMADRPSDALRMMAKIMVGRFASNDDPIGDEDSVVAETWERYAEEIKDNAVEEMISRLKEKHPQHEELLNEGREKASRAVDTIAALHSNGVTIQIPQNAARENQIQINGNNNIVILPQITVIALPDASDKGGDSIDPTDETVEEDE